MCSPTKSDTSQTIEEWLEKLPDTSTNESSDEEVKSYIDVKASPETYLSSVPSPRTRKVRAHLAHGVIRTLIQVTLKTMTWTTMTMHFGQETMTPIGNHKLLFF